MYFSDKNVVYLAKILPLFFCCTIPTFSTFVFFHFVLLSQLYFVYDFSDKLFHGPWTEVVPDTHNVHEKLLNIFTFNLSLRAY